MNNRNISIVKRRSIIIDDGILDNYSWTIVSGFSVELKAM